MGRIVSSHPGRDGLVQAVTVHSQHGEYKRPIAKLSLLEKAGVKNCLIVSTNVVSRLGGGDVPPASCLFIYLFFVLLCGWAGRLVAMGHVLMCEIKKQVELRSLE